MPGAGPVSPVGTIAGLVDDRSPDAVELTGHGDHRTVSAWVSAALTGRGTIRPRLLHTAVSPTMACQGADIHARFMVYEPGLPVTWLESDLAAHLKLNGRLLDAKIRALRARASETRVLEPPSDRTATRLGGDRVLRRRGPR